MMTESSARWAMYEMTIDKISMLIAGAECMYSRAVASLYEAVAASGIDAAAVEYEKLAMTHDLLKQLRDVHDALVTADESNAEEAVEAITEN